MPTTWFGTLVHQTHTAKRHGVGQLLTETASSCCLTDGLLAGIPQAAAVLTFCTCQHPCPQISVDEVRQQEKEADENKPPEQLRQELQALATKLATTE